MLHGGELVAGMSELGSVVEERQRVCEAQLLRPTSWKVPSRVPLGSSALCACPGKSPGVPTHISLLFQGRIACANVLSDLYAMGVTECDNMLMLLGVSNKMTDRVSRSLPARLWHQGRHPSLWSLDGDIDSGGVGVSHCSPGASVASLPDLFFDSEVNSCLDYF